MGANRSFSKLLEPTAIGQMTVRNRIYMSPMADRYGIDGYVMEKQKFYYEARAKGGTGLVVIGASCVDFPLGMSDSFHTYLDDDKFIPGLTELAAGIKKHGARAAIELNHAGPRAQSDLQPVSPSGCGIQPSCPIQGPRRQPA